LDNSEFFLIFVAELILNDKNMELKLIRENIGFFEPIHLVHNGKGGNRTISIVKIQISVRSKKPTILYNSRKKEFKYKNLSDESKWIVDEIVERNKLLL
jgi:hypothetical protein